LLGYPAQSLNEEMREKQNVIAISKNCLLLFDSNDVSAANAFEKKL